MRIVFAGTPDFATQSLKAIYQNKFNIVGVFTQPDKKSGRGKKIKKSSVKEFAESKNLRIFQPPTLKNNKVVQQIKDLKADIIIVVAYGQILTQEILDIPTYGCINIHASLLPKWRGAAPIQRAILAGDDETGICIMQMDIGLDTGDVLLSANCKILQTDDTNSLHNKLANLGSQKIIEYLNNNKKLTPKKQIGKTSYAQKITKNEAYINWENNAIEIARKVRAFNPYPIAQTYITTNKFENKILRILEVEVVKNIQTDLFIDKNQIIINTKDEAISLKKVQLAGKKPINIKDFNNAYQLLKIDNSI